MNEPLKSLCECNWPKRAISNDWFPVTYDEKLCEFQLVLDCGEQGKGSAILNFCPSCGGAFPDSKRGSLFANPTEHDKNDVCEVMSGIKTVGDMMQRLGESDETFKSADRNQYTYRNRWDSLELIVVEQKPGLSWIISGRQTVFTD